MERTNAGGGLAPLPVRFLKTKLFLGKLSTLILPDCAPLVLLLYSKIASVEKSSVFLVFTRIFAHCFLAEK